MSIYFHPDKVFFFLYVTSKCSSDDIYFCSYLSENPAKVDYRCKSLLRIEYGYSCVKIFNDRTDGFVLFATFFVRGENKNSMRKVIF